MHYRSPGRWKEKGPREYSKRKWLRTSRLDGRHESAHPKSSVNTNWD
jgi:hypothetical protein